MSEALEVVKRFEALMVQRLQEDGMSAEERSRRILELLDPEVVFRVTPSLPHGGDHVGHEGFRRLGERFTEAWHLVSGGNHEYHPIGDDRVVVFTNPSVFQSRATGETVSFRMVELVTVKNGRIVEFIPFYTDTVALNRAAGGTGAPA
jgi:ketosteroid isomerase-like protein